MTRYTVQQDPLNGGRWQPKVWQTPDGNSWMWFDAGRAFDTRAEAEQAARDFEAADRRLEPRPSRRLRLRCPSGHTWRTTLDRTADPTPGRGLCPDCACWGTEVAT